MAFKWHPDNSNCPYSPYGCSVLSKSQQELQSHLLTSNEEHISQVTEYVSQLKSELPREEARELFTNLSSMIGQLDTRIKSIEENPPGVGSSENETISHLNSKNLISAAHIFSPINMNLLESKLNNLERKFENLEQRFSSEIIKLKPVENISNDVIKIKMDLRKFENTFKNLTNFKDLQDRVVELENNSNIFENEFSKLAYFDGKLITMSERTQNLENFILNNPRFSEETFDFEDLKISLENLQNEFEQIKNNQMIENISERPTNFESVQNELNEFKKKHRTQIKSVEEQMESLTHSANHSSLEISKMKLKMNSDLANEINELKNSNERTQTLYSALEFKMELLNSLRTEKQMEEATFSSDFDSRTGLREMIDNILEQMGVFESARDMDSISIEHKLLQTKVDILEESYRTIRHKLRSLQLSGMFDDCNPLDFGETQDENYQIENRSSLSEDLTKLKTCLAMTNSELKSVSKNTETSLNRFENEIISIQNAFENQEIDLQNALTKIKTEHILAMDSFRELQSSSQTTLPQNSELQTDEIEVSSHQQTSNQTDEDMKIIKLELNEARYKFNDNFTSFRESIETLYTQFNVLSRRIEVLATTTSVTNIDEQMEALRQTQRQIIAQNLEDASSQFNKQLESTLNKIWSKLENQQNDLITINEKFRGSSKQLTHDFNRRVQSIEEFLQKDLPNMGVTASQKATLEKLTDERSETIKNMLSHEVSLEVVDLKRQIEEILNIKTKFIELEKIISNQATELVMKKEEIECDISQKINKFRQNVTDLDSNAEKIFDSLREDINKLKPRTNIPFDTETKVKTLGREINKIKEEIQSIKLIHSSSSDLGAYSSYYPNSDISNSHSPEHAMFRPSSLPTIPLEKKLTTMNPPLRVDSLSKSTHNVESHSHLLESRAAERNPSNGEQIIYISNIQLKILDQTIIISEPFLSSIDGYTFNISIQVLASSSTAIKLKISLDILPSDIDERLEWPVEGNVRFQIMNQLQDFAHIHLDERFYFNFPVDQPRVSTMQRFSLLTVPTTDPNSVYCVNDSLYIRVHITNLSNVC